jgi:hypothetical protein
MLVFDPEQPLVKASEGDGPEGHLPERVVDLLEGDVCGSSVTGGHMSWYTAAIYPA